MNRFFQCLAAVIFFFLTGCKHTLPFQNDPVGPSAPDDAIAQTGNVSCDPDTIYFQQQVLPVLVSNCSMSGCHDDASHQDGVILTSYSAVMNTAEIRPGRPKESELYERITETDIRERMPLTPRPPLSQEQKELIYKWIQQGAKNTSCEQSCDALAAVTYSQQVRSVITSKCAGCHGGTSPQGGINLTTYAGLKAKVDDGRLWGAINHLTGFSSMPKNGSKLSDCELVQIKKWIDAGAPNN
jgi:uncharacterized membrane protein